MAQIAVINSSLETQREIQLPEEIFGVPYRQDIIHEAVLCYAANQRLGTHSTKRRDEVSGSGKKLWKQKHTGRARMGEVRSPLWYHGGIVFGPKPRDYSYAIPRKVRRKAMRSLLAERLRRGALKVIDGLTLEGAKTKAFVTKIQGGGPTHLAIRAPPSAARAALPFAVSPADCTSSVRATVTAHRTKIARGGRVLTTQPNMPFEQYHEPPEELDQATRTFARMIMSLIEEAEAIGWYEQRLAVEKDRVATAIMENAQHEEMKHFGMDLEFLLRKKPEWRETLRGILFKPGNIVKHADEAEESTET